MLHQLLNVREVLEGLRVLDIAVSPALMPAIGWCCLCAVVVVLTRGGSLSARCAPSIGGAWLAWDAILLAPIPPNLSNPTWANETSDVGARAAYAALLMVILVAVDVARRAASLQDLAWVVTLAAFTLAVAHYKAQMPHYAQPLAGFPLHRIDETPVALDYALFYFGLAAGEAAVVAGVIVSTVALVAVARPLFHRR